TRVQLNVLGSERSMLQIVAADEQVAFLRARRCGFFLSGFAASRCDERADPRREPCLQESSAAGAVFGGHGAPAIITKMHARVGRGPRFCRGAANVVNQP